VKEWSLKKEYIFFSLPADSERHPIYSCHIFSYFILVALSINSCLLFPCTFTSRRSTLFSEIYAKNKHISSFSTEQASQIVDFLNIIPEVPIYYVGLDTLYLVRFLSVPADKDPRSRKCPFYRFPVRGLLCRTESLHPPTHRAAYFVPKGTLQETCCNLYETSLHII